ncbi:MAG: primosomal protein N' [Halothiobacillaceae bacterium]
MIQEAVVLKVAVDAPVEGVFDYVLPLSWEGGCDALVGRRVRVPFGASVRMGVVVAESGGEPSPELRAIEAVLDNAPLLEADDLRLGQWLAGYYHAPLGEVLALMLPASLRGGAVMCSHEVRGWRVLPSAPMEVSGAPRQTEVLRLLHESAQGVADADLRGMTAVLRALEQRGFVARCVLDAAEQMMPEQVADVPLALHLNAEQVAASEAIGSNLGQFAAFLLHGITGSGKTEVYLAAMTQVLQRGLQVLVLVPEIALTPQLVGRFAARFQPLGAEAIVVLHSAMTARARELAWQAAKFGRARVVLGTRSAVLTPLPRLGLIVVDEEHDPSYKQQEGWRYHARDVAVVRAQQRRIPVVLGSATPALESMAQVAQGRYRLLRLTERAGGARMPRLELLDVRKRPLQEGLSAPLLEKMTAHLLVGGQVLLFLNRRGFAPQLACHACGHVEVCRQCSAPMTVHRGRGRLVCHHCGAERAVPRVCAACGANDLQMPGQGTERVEMALRGLFPEFALERIDRDTTRRKGELESKLARAHSGEARILLGTQMLAKGHDFAGVTLAVILDADSGLMSNDFRAPERLVQLIVQVAGRAGRADKPGEVLIQTHQPEHPLLQALLHGGFERCAELLMQERELARLPPFAHLALLRAEAKDASKAQGFLMRCAAFFKEENTEAVQVWGPAPAPLERRAGRFRFQLLLVGSQRAPLHRAMEQFGVAQQSWAERRGVKWGLDIDPQEMG